MYTRDQVLALLVAFNNEKGEYKNVDPARIDEWFDAKDAEGIREADEEADIDEDQPDHNDAIHIVNDENENDTYFIALEFASYEHRKSAQETVIKWIVQGMPDQIRTTTRSVANQYLIVISDRTDRLMDILENIDEMTIVYDHVQANEYFEELT